MSSILLSSGRVLGRVRFLGPLVSKHGRIVSLSTNAPQKDVDFKRGGNKHGQTFVDTDIEPGEWDDNMTDPLYRPKYKSKARIISRDEFANQNRVTFEEQYDNFADAMITLDWMDHKRQEKIYDSYLQLMSRHQELHGKTSHEYVCRLVAQRFSITPFRAAAIIQLQHNEEQYKLNEPDRPLLNKEAEMMDYFITQCIKEAYESTGETPPGSSENFVEPIPAKHRPENPAVVVVEDLYDVDQMTKDANVREQERARLLIDDHHYIEDKDDETMEIPMTKDALRLIKQKEKLAETAAEPLASPTAKEAEQQKKERRPRWKFVAQTIDTRDLNPKSKFSHVAQDGKVLSGRKHRMRFQSDWAENTLIEQDGDLRAANLAEVRKTSWKPVRHVQEFTYAGAKKGWLDKTVRSKENMWGKKNILPGEEEDEKSPLEGKDNTEATETSASNGVNAEIEHSEKNASDGSSSSEDDSESESDADSDGNLSDSDNGTKLDEDATEEKKYEDDKKG